MQTQVFQHYATVSPGNVEVAGIDLWNGTTTQLNTFRTQTGITFPLLLNGATATGGNVSTLYGTYDNFIVMDADGIVRYHAALTYPLGNRFHLDEIRAVVDDLVPGFVSTPPGTTPADLALSVAPHPARGPASLTLALPRPAAEVRVEVLDLAGRVIERLHDGPAAAGELRLVWSARDRGGAAAPGIYLAVAHIDGQRRVQRLALVR